MISDRGRNGKVRLLAPADRLQRIPSALRESSAYVTDLIERRLCRYKCDCDGYVRLKKPYVASVLGRKRTDQALTHLEELDLLTARPYQRGVRCAGYALTGGPDDMTTIEVTDPRLIETLRSRYQHQYPVHRHLRSFLPCVSLAEGAYDKVAQLISKSDDVSSATLHRISRSLLRHIDAGWYRTRWCARGRYYHEITCLAKELRPLLRLDGEALAGFDISKSQPLFLGLLALRNFDGRSARQDLKTARLDSKGVYPYKDKSLRAIGQRCDGLSALVVAPQRFATFDAHVVRENSQLASLLPPLPSSSSLGVSADVQKFLCCCLSGQLYESLAGEGLTRADVKGAMMWVLFGKPGWSRNRVWNEVKRRFGKLFPSMANMLLDLKKNNHRGERKHAHVAHLTQSLEATTVIGAICRRAIDHIPHIPIITIHDSFFTSAGRLEVLYDFVREAFMELFGVAPHFKPEGCAPSGRDGVSVGRDGSESAQQGLGEVTVTEQTAP